MIKDRALFCYGFDINVTNQTLAFKTQAGGTEYVVYLDQGNYTLTKLLAHIKSKMEIADPLHTFTVWVDRSIDSGRSMRVHISTDATHLDLLFSSGTAANATVGTLLGFLSSDYTGATSYAASSNPGTILIPEMPIYDYLGPDQNFVNDGVKSVSASGVKETLVFAQMRFIQGQWKYITNNFGQTQLSEWTSFMKYATQQKKFEIVPSIFEDFNIFYEVTLEATPEDQNGMAFKFKQMRSDGLYRFYDTGLLKFRVNPQ